MERLSTAFELAAAFLIIVLICFALDPYLCASVPFLFAGPLWIFAAERGVVSALLRSSPLQTLGTWSYGIYLVHFPVTEILNHWLALAQKGIMKTYGSTCPVGFVNAGATATSCGTADITALILMTGFYFSLVLILSKWSFEYIEAPFRRGFSRWALLYQMRT